MAKCPDCGGEMHFYEGQEMCSFCDSFDFSSNEEEYLTKKKTSIFGYAQTDKEIMGKGLSRGSRSKLDFKENYKEMILTTIRDVCYNLDILEERKIKIIQEDFLKLQVRDLTNGVSRKAIIVAIIESIQRNKFIISIQGRELAGFISDTDKNIFEIQKDENAVIDKNRPTKVVLNEIKMKNEKNIKEMEKFMNNLGLIKPILDNINSYKILGEKNNNLLREYEKTGEKNLIEKKEGFLSKELIKQKGEEMDIHKILSKIDSKYYLLKDKSSDFIEFLIKKEQISLTLEQKEKIFLVLRLIPELTILVFRKVYAQNKNNISYLKKNLSKNNGITYACLRHFLNQILPNKNGNPAISFGVIKRFLDFSVAEGKVIQDDLRKKKIGINNPYEKEGLGRENFFRAVKIVDKFYKKDIIF